MATTRSDMSLLALLLVVSVAASTCPPHLMQSCESCNVDNFCDVCKLGYFKEQSASSGDICIPCGLFCNSCTSLDDCTDCQPGFVSSLEGCLKCSPECNTCTLTPENCTSCQAGYLKDSKNQCYYRYTLIAMIGVALGFVLLVMGVFKCLSTIVRERKFNPNSKSQSHESILGEEFRHSPTFISDVNGIGKSMGFEEQDHDLSYVADTRDDGTGLDDSIRHEEIFDATTGRSRGNSSLRIKHAKK